MVVVGCFCGGGVCCCRGVRVGKVVVDWQWWVYGFGFCVSVGLLIWALCVGLLSVSGSGTVT